MRWGFGAVGFHGEDLRQAAAAADEGDLGAGFGVPAGRDVGASGGGCALQISAAIVAT